MSNKFCVLLIAAAAVILVGAQCVWADYGNWKATTSGNWGDPANWVGGTIADGDGFIADFSNVDIPAGSIISVNVDTPRTIGELWFADADNSTPGSFLISGSNILTLSDSTTSNAATIYVSPQGGSLPLVEISAPMEVASGNSLVLDGNLGLGAGILKLSGNTTVDNGNATVQHSNTVNLSGSMKVQTGSVTVTGTSTFNVTGSLSTTSSSTANGMLTVGGGNTLNVSGTGSLNIAGWANAGSGNTLNIGLAPADTVTATFLGGDTTPSYGDNAYAALWNDGYGNSTITIRGNGTTVSTTGAVVDEVRIGRYGDTSGTATLEMHDNSVLNTALLRVSEFAAQAQVNLYDNARINATTVEMAHWFDPSLASNITLTLNESSKLYATTVRVGHSGSAKLVVGTSTTDTAEVHVSTLYCSDNGYWPGSSSYGVTGEVDVNGHGKIFAAAIISDGNWPSTTNNVSIYNFTDNAAVSVTGDYTAGTTAHAGSTITMNKNAQLSVGGGLYIAGTASNQGTATLSVTCNPGETASVTANSMIVGGPNWNEIGTFNLSGNATATVTNNLGIALGNGGTGTNTSGYVNVSDNAQLQVGSITMAPLGNGGTRQLNISGAAQVRSTGDFNIGSATGWPSTSPTVTVTVSDNSSLTIGGNVSDAGTPAMGGVTLKGNATMSVTGNYSMGGGSNYVTTDVTGGGVSTNTSLTVGGNVTLGSTHGNLLVNSIGSGAPPNGGLRMTGITSTLYFNGGQIQPGVATTTFLQGLPHAIIQSGGAKFAVYHNVTVAENLEHDSALGGTADGGLADSGNSILTLTGALTYTGNTTIDNNATLTIDSPGTTTLAAITGTGAALGNLVIGDGVVDNTVSATSVNVGTITLSAGSTLVIRALPGGPTAGLQLTPVPEPSTFVLLTIAALGLIWAAWRKRK